MFQRRSARSRAFKKINEDLGRAAKESGTPRLSIEDTAHSRQRYPELIPVLVDWIEHVDDKVAFDDPLDRAQFLDAVARSLVTPDAKDSGAVDALAAYLRTHPDVPTVALQGAPLAISHAARARDEATVRELATDRHLGEARAPLLEWLIGRKKQPLLDAAVGELDDPTVAAHILRRLRAVRDPATLPTGLAEAVHPLQQAEQEETRVQAAALLAKLEGR